MRFRHLHILSALFLIIGMAVQFVASYRNATNYVNTYIEMEKQIAHDKFLFELYDLHDIGEQLQDYVKLNLEQPNDIGKEARLIIKHYPHFVSCYVSFIPNYYPGKGKWFCLDTYRKGDSIITINYGDEQHDYFQRDWYIGAMESGKEGFWSRSYKDDILKEQIFTHSIKITDQNGNAIGVVGLDFSLACTKQLLEDTKPCDDAVCLLYGSDDELIASSDNLKGQDLSLLNESDWIVSRQTLSPIDMKLVFAVPKRFVWHHIRWGMLLSLAVFVSGIVVVGFLIRRMLRDQRKYARVEMEKEVMEHELQIAHQIQMDILRHDFPNDDEVEIHANLLPMREVGGDLYDFYRRDEYLWFIIGDVSGKGVPAAMFMAATVNLFRTAVQRLSSPKEIAEELNTVLSDNNPSLTFVTAIIGRLHIPSGQMLYCNAGHCEPLLKHGSTNVEWLKTEADIPLGYDKTFHFTEHNHLLAQDTTLVLYTDGITEARNINHTMLGCQRWEKIVAQDGNMLEAVLGYIGKAEQTDDITLFAIHKKGTGHKTTNDLN